MVADLAEGLAGRSSGEQVEPVISRALDQRRTVRPGSEVSFDDLCIGEVESVCGAGVRIVVRRGDYVEPGGCEAATEPTRTGKEVDRARDVKHAQKIGVRSDAWPSCLRRPSGMPVTRIP